MGEAGCVCVCVGGYRLPWAFSVPNKGATYHPQTPSTQQPCRQMGMEEGSGGPHLVESPSFHEEVFLQCGIGFHRPPGLILHTQQPAQGQADKSGAGDTGLVSPGEKRRTCYRWGN